MKTRNFNTILYLAFIALVLGSGCSKDSVKPEFYIGKEFGGGVVFLVSEDGLHGLIAETVDQGESDWYDAFTLVNTGTHSEAGKAYTDWRLPSIWELRALHLRKDIIGGFEENGDYWSYEEIPDSDGAIAFSFHIGYAFPSNKSSSNFVRAVRDF